MASPANSTVQNLLPVQAYFNVDGSFNTFVGQGVPFTVGGVTSLGINNTTNNASYNVTFTDVNTGNITALSVTSTKLLFNPSTGALSATSFIGNVTGTASLATALAGGSASQIPYQSGAGVTAFLANGTSGQFLTSNGAAAPSWTTPTTGVTVADDTTTNASRYLTFTSATSGNITTVNTGSTKLSINPSTGLLSLISATMAGTSSAYGFKTPNIAEPSTVSATAATGTINYDVTTQSVLYYTSNASANWTVNFRGSSGTSLNTVMATNDTLCLSFAVTQGATAYYNSVIQIDGTTSGVTTKWQGSAPTSGNASAVDVYNYVIIKTGSATFTVLASQTKFA